VNRTPEGRPVILVVGDVEETRRGIEKLLLASGYCISLAGDDEEAVSQAIVRTPDLILMSLGLDVPRAFITANRIREAAGLTEQVPVVVFCAPELQEGDEIAAGRSVYMMQPDNFDQLRASIKGLLQKRLLLGQQ
jgi:DNA-binding response OmpR family regulator